LFLLHLTESQETFNVGQICQNSEATVSNSVYSETIL